MERSAARVSIRGIILAGGTGTRLHPATKVINKHLLPVYDKPMIFYPLQTLIGSGVRDILIISTRSQLGSFMELLGSGQELGARLTYAVQEGSGGIADALSIAEDFSAVAPVAVLLGDNIFSETFSADMNQFSTGAKVFLKEVSDPERFGVAELSGDQVVSIEEKPLRPKSNYAVTGLYLYDSEVFEMIRAIEPSGRGELEITDVNNEYVKRGSLRATVLRGEWADAGTHDSLLEASIVAQRLSGHAPEKGIQHAHTPKVAAGLVFYNADNTPSSPSSSSFVAASAYYEPCLESLLKQDYAATEIWVLDNASPNTDYLKNLKKKFPEVHFIESKVNLGFGGGHNVILRSSESDFYACLNADVLYEPDFISKSVEMAQTDPAIGAVAGKLKRWDFDRYQKEREANKIQDAGKTNFIDSVGIRMRKSHRFEDRGQGEVDYGQYDESTHVFGVSGAAALYRRKALDSIVFINEKGEREFFDELFFMYKEDIDLAYRLQWAGWKAVTAPRAIAYHDRTVTQGSNTAWGILQNRKNKSRMINEWSFLNQELLLRKHFSGRYSGTVKRATALYKLKSLAYVLLFEPHLLSQYRRLRAMSDAIEKRILRMPKRVSEKEIESLME